jgi:hypothetical protein
MMNKKIKILYRAVSLIGFRGESLLTRFLFLLLILGGTSAFAQNNCTIRGLVLDEQQNPIIGATVALKSNTSVGTVTDMDGKFILSVPSGNQSLVITFIGMEKQEVAANKEDIIIVMKTAATQINEVVVVGYGKQKKESVVGAISQTSGKILESSGGVSNLGMALTGNLPGVIVSSSTGMPGPLTTMPSSGRY